MKKYALISVSNKIDIVDFALSLNRNGYDILATGNTAKLLLSEKVNCTEISDITKFPEIFSGRVKTLHPKIMGGVLMRQDNEDDIKQASETGIFPIDIVCVNLYPFPQIVNRVDISNEEKIENIDIGGPSLIRAAAKNYKYVSVLTNPNQYKAFVNELDEGKISTETRENLATEAFAHTAFYDSLISKFFSEQFNPSAKSLTLALPLSKSLRYGENPHQNAFLYGNFSDYFDVVHGKELSYNNIVDLTSAVEIVDELGENSCVIVKHTNPCGSATAKDLLTAYTNALSCDPVSAFGGIVAFNSEVTSDIADKLNEIFLEIVTAPKFTDEALQILKKKKNRRILIKKKTSENNKQLLKTVPGGVLVQDYDNSSIDDIEFKLVTDRKLSDGEIEDLKFAWIICKHTKSNAIVFAKDKMGIGIGAGQMSRIDSANIAVGKALEHGHSLEGAVAASDAFFPFADGVEAIAKQGIKAIIQPGGSVRDNEVIEAANKLNISMIFTGIRNFKH